MTSSVNGIAFVILAAAVLLGAFNMMSTRNVVHAGYWMLETLVATAGVYLLLAAEFVALVQLMVYAGAVAILVLFVVMLTLRRREDAERSLDFSWVAMGGAVFFALGMGVALWGYTAPAVAFPATAPGTEALGLTLFTAWLLPFELASIVLLVAVIGAVYWALGSERS